MSQLFNENYPTDQILIYNTLSLAQYMVQMTPPSVLMATVITLSTLSRSNELVACYSIGIGLRQVMTVIFSIVFMICCLTLVMQDRVLPPFFKKQEVFFWHEMKNRPDFFMDFKQDKIWYRSKNFIYNLKSFDLKSNTIFGIAIYAFDEAFRLVEVIEARKAHFSENGWQLEEGTVTLFSAKDDFPMTKSFEHKDLKIDETPRDFQEIEKKVEGLRLKELNRYIDRVKATGTDVKAYRVQFHSKISLSFISLVMCLLAIPFSTRSRREGGLSKDISVCVGVTFIYWVFYSTSLSLGTKGTFNPVIAAWLPTFVFGSLAAGMVYWKWKR